MNWLEKIGLIAIIICLFFIGRYYRLYLKKKTSKFNEKATILISYHPEIKKMFDDYLTKERNRISNSYQKDDDYDDYDDGYRGTTKLIFGLEYNIYNSHIEIEGEITKRIKQLEESENERKIIDEMISVAKKSREKYVADVELKLAKIKKKYLDNKTFLNSLFPKYTNTLTEETIIFNIENYFNLSNSAAQNIFKDLTESSTQIVFEEVKKLGQKTGIYWYSEKTVIDIIEKLQSEITYATYKYH